MPTAKEARSERNKIRAHYEKKFAGRLQEKDASIKSLLRANDDLRKANKELQQALEAEKALREQQDELVRQLQELAQLSGEDLEKAKAAIRFKAEASRHVTDIKTALNALAGANPYGAMSMMPALLENILADIKG